MEYTLADGRGLLRRTPSVLHSLLSDLPDAWLLGDEGPGTWSPRQVLMHLLHTEDVDWIDRTRVILAHGADHVFVPVDREAGFERYAELPVEELLGRFADARTASLAALDTLVRPDDLGRPGRHPEFGPVTLGELLATWVVHDLNHLGQIVTTMAKQYKDAVGPWRAYLPILDAP